MVFLQKLGLAIGLFLVGVALDIAGFIETIPGETPPIQPESALMAIRVAIAPLPTIFLMVGLLLTYLYPITRDIHNEILLKLEERKQKRSKT